MNHNEHAKALDQRLQGLFEKKVAEFTRFSEENRKANLAFVELLGRIAERKQATPAQIALAWLLTQKPWIVPIPGTTKLHRLDENIAAVVVDLTKDDLEEIEVAASQIEVRGARYSEAAQKMINR